MLEKMGLASPRRWDMLAFGDPNVDLVFAVDHAPGADQKVLGRRLGQFAGGTVANVACAASNLGLSTQVYGRVGDDSEGVLLTREFSRFGVGLEQLKKIPDTASSMAIVMVESSGEKALIYSPMQGTVPLGSSFLQALTQSRLLYAMPYDMEEFSLVHGLAREAGVIIAIDVEAVMITDLVHMRRLMAMCDIVFMNEATYLSIFNEPPQLKAMQERLHSRQQILVVTRGSNGAMAVSGDVGVEVPAFHTKVIDTTGAGDCFNGAFLAALFDGLSLTSALRFACAAGSFALEATGARSSLPNRAQVDARLAGRSVL